MKYKLRFERFEFKYLLDVDTYHAIRRHVAHFMSSDPETRGVPHGFYEVISLYYDSPRFYHYWEKIDGAPRRKKIRLRTYRINGRDLSPNIFFEIKRKSGVVILKDRLALNYADYVAFLRDGSADALPAVDKYAESVREEYRFDRGARCLSPKIIVVYSREPYIGKYDKNLRITFDFGIKAKNTDDLFDLNGRFTDVSGANVVMEVKFRGALPFYVERILQEFGLVRVAYSKYCKGTEACYSLPLLALLGNKNQSNTLDLRRGRLNTTV